MSVDDHSNAPTRDSLAVIGRRHNCDKFTLHAYGDVYESHLSKWRDAPIKLLEIGIGGLEEGLGGESLAVWEEYFPNAAIIGIDIYDKSVLERGRVKTVVADQSDALAMNEVARLHGPFDVVIDDGSHRANHILASFDCMFQHLNVGGYYIIEDLQTAYWSSYGGTSIAGGLKHTSVSLIKRLVDVLHADEIVSPDHAALKVPYAIEGLHVHHNIALIQKAYARKPSAILTDALRASELAADRAEIGQYEALEALLERDTEARRRAYDVVLKAMRSD